MFENNLHIKILPNCCHKHMIGKFYTARDKGDYAEVFCEVDGDEFVPCSYEERETNVPSKMFEVIRTWAHDSDEPVW